MNIVILVGILDNGIVFIDSETGDTIDPVTVLELSAGRRIHVSRKSRVEQITTRLKAFGAIADGFFTVVGHKERDIEFSLVIEIESSLDLPAPSESKNIIGQ